MTKTEEVAAIDPGTPGCDCPGCAMLRRMRERIDPIAIESDGEIFGRIAGGGPPADGETDIPAWEAIAILAVMRLVHMGADGETIADLVRDGLRLGCESMDSHLGMLNGARPAGHA